MSITEYLILIDYSVTLLYNVESIVAACTISMDGAQ